jgi:hypothetical protein
VGVKVLEAESIKVLSIASSIRLGIR